MMRRTGYLWLCCLVSQEQRAAAGFTSRTRKPSCMYRGSMARSSSMVSYWPWQAFSFSRVPSMHFSSTKPTRKIIFTPSGGRGWPMSMFGYLTRREVTERLFVTITEEHVPDPQYWGPGQRPGKGTHKPLSHVEDGVDLVFLQVAVGYGGDATQQSKQDLSIQLYSFLKNDTGRKRWTKGPLSAFVAAETWPTASSVKHMNMNVACGSLLLSGEKNIPKTFPINVSWKINN